MGKLTLEGKMTSQANLTVEISSEKKNINKVFPHFILSSSKHISLSQVLRTSLGGQVRNTKSIIFGAILLSLPLFVLRRVHLLRGHSVSLLYIIILFL
jgi:hypothetical protein